MLLSTRVRWVQRMLGSAIIARRCRKKARRISKGLPLANAPELKGAISKRFDGYTFDLWHKAYAAATGQPCVDYVPEDLFYNVFESRLNPRHRRAVYRDKNFYDRLGWSCLPQTIFRIIDGRLFDRSYHQIDAETALALARESGLSEFVAKPARETGGGARVTFLDFDGLASFVPGNLKRNSDWIVQHPIRQHSDMARLNASSVNTVRIVTIRMDAQVSVVSAFLRFGIGGSRVDNLTAGNVAVGVEEDGRLRKEGYDIKLRRVATHPTEGFAFDSFVIPSYRIATQACIDLHAGIPDLDLISWDIAIDEHGRPTVIEFNIGRQDISVAQVCNGPVLNPYIDKVLARNKWFVIPGIGAIDRQADMEPEYVR
jgi:hypothetical protein